MMLWMPANCLLDKSYVEIIRCQNGKRKEKHHLILRSEKRAALGKRDWFTVTNIIQLQLENYYCCCAQLLDAIPNP